MLDLILGALLVGLAIRGWMRGLVKEIISLTVLVVGTIAAFRLSTPVGRIFANMSGASPAASRYVAGIAIFFGVAIGAAIISRVLHLGIRFLPGVSTLNRAAGAALSLIALTLLVTLAVSAATVVTLPEGMQEQLDDSAVAATLIEPDGVPQRVLSFLSGDRVVEISLRIRNLTGSERAVATADAPLSIPAADTDDLDRLPAAEKTAFDLLNRERISADVDPVLRSPGLDRIAFDLALAGYVEGHVAVLAESELRALLNDAGMPAIQQAQLVVLAASPEGAHAALVDQMADTMVRDGYTRAGIAIVQGPVGLVVVELMSG